MTPVRRGGERKKKLLQRDDVQTQLCATGGLKGAQTQPFPLDLVFALDSSECALLFICLLSILIMLKTLLLYECCISRSSLTCFTEAVVLWNLRVVSPRVAVQIYDL